MKADWLTQEIVRLPTLKTFYLKRFLVWLCLDDDVPPNMDTLHLPIFRSLMVIKNTNSKIHLYMPLFAIKIRSECERLRFGTLGKKIILRRFFVSPQYLRKQKRQYGCPLCKIWQLLQKNTEETTADNRKRGRARSTYKRDVESRSRNLIGQTNPWK